MIADNRMIILALAWLLVFQLIVNRYPLATRTYTASCDGEMLCFKKSGKCALNLNLHFRRG
jgi:hypothetical protein